MNLNKVKPKDILEIVNFNIEDTTWKYDEQNKDMYAYQAEGSAGLWNRLEYYSFAILADEVGMGKTYQALAVVAKLFSMNEDAKVLIITPRIEVLRQWKEVEYGQFKKNHLRDSSLLPLENKLDALQNLAEGLNPNGATIIFTKTTSFSQNVDIEKCKESLKKFDLVIVDEAHKYRNFNIDSDENNNRTKNAHDIFKDSNVKILLMTATPLHSKRNDVVNMANVFKPKIFNTNIEKNSDSIMKCLMVRRLRVMVEQCNKYHYREEKEIEVDLSTKDNDYKNELFFAMLQKEIVKKGEDKNLSKSKYLLDLLEGTTYAKVYKDESKENDGVDKIFNNVVEKFKKNYGKFPSNQKYNTVLDNVWRSKEKALIFVRRRASAIELSRLYMEEFDKKAWALLSDNNRIPKRENFDSVLGIKTIGHKVDLFLEKNFIYDYFNAYKEEIDLKKGTKDKTILEHMAHNFFDSYNDINKKNYEQFMDNFLNKPSEYKDTSIVKSKVLDFFKTKKHENSTSASRFVRKFDKGRAYEEFFTKFLPKKLEYEDEKIELIKSAILHASIGIIELYKCDMKTKNYKSFCKKVSKIIDDSIFAKEIKDFLDNFDKCKKYFEFNNNSGNSEKDKEHEENIEKFDAKIFYNAQPIYAYLADTKNKSVIAQFNTPFFPYVLSGTSTLQEGLNLHLQCNKVYHFGSAYTMGDDEQRTGRVDRIHGKMYRELIHKKDTAKLNIYYPYLKNTFDEENLRNMLCQKRMTEKKIDKCLIEANNEPTMIHNCDKTIGELTFKSISDASTETEPFGWEMKP